MRTLRLEFAKVRIPSLCRSEICTLGYLGLRTSLNTANKVNLHNHIMIPELKINCISSGLRIAAFAMLCMLGVNGCTTKKDVSTDVAALQKIVHLDFAASSAKWEVFGTPEYKGGLPLPTDFKTLIAEISPVDPAAFAATPASGKFWIAPEAARSWLFAPFRNMLAVQKNGPFDLSNRHDCRGLNATLAQTGTAVSGFGCIEGERMLVYLTIADNTKS